MVESCDLFTLLSEFASLKQEINNQNKRHTKTIKQLDSFFEGAENTIKEINSYKNEINNLYKQVSEDTEERVLKSFLDVRDSLLRGLSSSENILKKNKFFIKKDDLKSLYSGYESALRRFDNVLSLYDIKVIKASPGEGFDPHTMEAYDTTENKEKNKGEIESVVSSGFKRNDRILRHSKVVVNR